MLFAFIQTKTMTNFASWRKWFVRVYTNPQKYRT